MYKLRAVWLLSFYFFAVWVGANLSADNTSDPAPGDYIVRIEGFQQYPATHFYQVSEKNASISVKRIHSNAVSYVNAISRKNSRISYNPKLKEFKENELYDVADLGLILDGDLFFEADEVILNRTGGLKGFVTITDYFRIKPASDYRQDDPRFTTEFYRRIYATTDFSISASGDYNKIPDFIRNNITMNSLLISGSRLRFSPNQLTTLRNFVRTSGNTHWINGEGNSLDAKTIYAREHTQIQNIKFAPYVPPKPPEEKPARTRHKYNEVGGNYRTQSQNDWKDVDARKFWIALFCTILIEGVLMVMIVPSVLKTRESGWAKSRDVFVITAFGNGITIPLIWWVFILPGLPHLLYVLISQVFAILVEGMWYSMMLRINIKQSLWYSLAANLTSWWIGVIIFDYMLNWIL